MNLLDEIPEDERSDAHSLAAEIAEEHGADDYAFQARGGVTTVHLLFDREGDETEAGATAGIHPDSGGDDDADE